MTPRLAVAENFAQFVALASQSKLFLKWKVRHTVINENTALHKGKSQLKIQRHRKTWRKMKAMLEKTSNLQGYSDV